MNNITAKYISKIFVQHKVMPFETKMFRNRISMQSVGKKLCININRKKIHISYMDY